MEGLSLDEKINLRFLQHIQFNNIAHSCLEKFHSYKDFDISYKKEFFNKCIKTKVNIFNHINNLSFEKSE